MAAAAPAGPPPTTSTSARSGSAAAVTFEDRVQRAVEGRVIEGETGGGQRGGRDPLTGQEQHLAGVAEAARITAAGTARNAGRWST